MICIHIITYCWIFHTAYIFWLTFFYYINAIYHWSRTFKYRPPPGHTRCWSVKNERPGMGHNLPRSNKFSRANSLRTRITQSKVYNKEESNGKSRGLEKMDHHRLSLLSYLFVITITLPNATTLWFINNILFKFMSFFQTPKEFNYHEQIIDVIMNSSLCRYVNERVDKNIFRFVFDDLPIMKTWEHAEKDAILEVEIDFKSRRVLSSSLQMVEDKLDLELEDLFTCIYFHAITTSHVQSHAMANFCVDTQVDNEELSFLSNLTIAYNYYGRKSVENCFATLALFGMLDQRPVSFTKSLQIGCNCRIMEHGNKLLHKLREYSPYIYFTLKLRKFFLDAYDESIKHGSLLSANIDGEALFVGTVIHSLDHYGLELADPRAFKCVNPLFEPMMQMCRVVRVGFVEDIPGFLFSTRFRDLQSPFYTQIYDFAKALDDIMKSKFQGYTGRCEFADQIEAAIIK